MYKSLKPGSIPDFDRASINLTLAFSQKCVIYTVKILKGKHYDKIVWGYKLNHNSANYISKTLGPAALESVPHETLFLTCQQGLLNKAAGVVKPDLFIATKEDF